MIVGTVRVLLETMPSLAHQSNGAHWRHFKLDSFYIGRDLARHCCTDSILIVVVLTRVLHQEHAGRIVSRAGGLGIAGLGSLVNEAEKR